MKTSRAIAEMEKGAVMKSHLGYKYRMRGGCLEIYVYLLGWRSASLIFGKELTNEWTEIKPKRKKK